MIRKYHNYKLQTDPRHFDGKQDAQSVYKSLRYINNSLLQNLKTEDIGLIVILSLSHVVSWVTYGTWLYRFLIFAIIPTFIDSVHVNKWDVQQLPQP